MPELRSWVKEQFGSTDDQSLLSENTISTKELREDEYILEQKLRGIESDLDEHEVKYKKIVKQAMQASDLKRPTLIQKGELERKKYQAEQQKYRKYRQQLGIVVTLRSVREIIGEDIQNITNIESVIDETDAATIQSELMSELAQFNMEMEDMQAIGDALDFEFMSEQTMNMADNPTKTLVEEGGDIDEIPMDEILGDEQESTGGSISMDMNIDNSRQ